MVETKARILCFALAFYGFSASPAWAKGQDDLRHRPAIKLCEQLVQSKKIRIKFLQAQDLIEEVAPRIFAFRGARLIETEMASLIRFSQTMPGRFLSVGNLPGIVGVPGIDAVYYPEDGGMPLNISIKTSTKIHSDKEDYIERTVYVAQNSLRKNFGANLVAERFGYYFEGEELVLARKGLSHQVYHQSLIKIMLHVMGIVKGKPTRPMAVLVDSSYAGESIAGVDVDDLTARLLRSRNHSKIYRYFILFCDSILTISRSGVAFQPRICFER